ncbi:helix-turn-helix domain-containing protein [Alistipes finegoldii]|jgi:transcriptional regulator with XRE-family HTH domain|uniref:helix-turn-helix domain-containing protein n=1 Tax=Alistipes finegoldii TaxID=214856 RepID=UPI001D064097|nr:helix-turn-helix transcriptional regulator [Alistipes finegoldii]MCB6684209.1 helix-turn-helix transcriptional regulator [Alistipes finegoldii]DAL82527.1 MAG TPA: Helix-turn-helix XRE-family like protein [Caudoviricetes sp.]
MELRVKEICKEKGMQMQELADKLGITRITLTRNISGNPTIGTLESIAAALGVSVPELFAPQPTNAITCPHCGKLIKVEKGE